MLALEMQRSCVSSFDVRNIDERTSISVGRAKWRPDHYIPKGIGSGVKAACKQIDGFVVEKAMLFAKTLLDTYTYILLWGMTSSKSSQ